MKGGYVYILTNKKRGVLYIGVTADLIRRIWEHANGVVKGFTKRYNLKTLVFFEQYEEIEVAISNEKKLKNLSRAKKIEIIEHNNPEWKDLYKELVG